MLKKNLMFNYDISNILYNYGLHWRSHKVISTELARSISLFLCLRSISLDMGPYNHIFTVQ